MYSAFIYGFLFQCFVHCLMDRTGMVRFFLTVSVTKWAGK
jgi:hypothetical protein